MKNKNKIDILVILAVVILMGVIVNFLFLPAWTVHSKGMWWSIIYLMLTTTLVSFMVGVTNKSESNVPVVLLLGTVGVFILYIILVMTGSRLVASSKYAKILEPSISTQDFTDYGATLDNVPLLDKESAMMIANRRLGTLEDVISQFGINDTEQITVKGEALRVSCLNYAGFFKWMNNKENGTPGYVKIDMQKQEAELVRVDGGINYSKGAYFGKNIHRYLRKNYRTAIFDETVLELDESEHPYWVTSILKPTIGMFGGLDVAGLVTVDAVTGEHTRYELEDIPVWVDNVYNSRKLMKQYDDYGRLQEGFWNTIFGQKGVRQTTKGYNYIPMGDDNWIYTGVTSVGRDESNIGFVLLNKRTKETHYYGIPGAEEFSAMSSAEGVVQHLGYKATFPLLLNVEGQPTYLVALKDSGKLVKMYGMVNVEKYQLVATGGSIRETNAAYKELLRESGAEVSQAENLEVEGTIEDIREGIKEGTTYYYIKIEGKSVYYSINLAENEPAIFLREGDSVRLLIEAEKDVKIIPARLP